MKKFVIYFFIFIFICFILPALLTKRDMATSIQTENIEQNQEQNDTTKQSFNAYNYNQYGTIKLLHNETGEVEEVKLDEYLCNVVSAEMPADYEIEALKAQAVVARTYTLYKIINAKPHGEEADICDSFECCQAWISKEERFDRWDDSTENQNWNKIVTAVNETKGKVVTYEGKIINAFFHANSGGKTEIPVNVWGGTGYPYLQVVETSGEEGYTQYSSEVQLTIEELVNKFKEKYEDIVVNLENINEEIKILEYTESGRVKTLKVGNKNIAGTEVRTILGLRSTNFDIEINENNVTFKVIGYGHGIGMSQTGADAMAKQGSNYEQIIKHFYVGVEIVDI